MANVRNAIRVGEVTGPCVVIAIARPRGTAQQDPNDGAHGHTDGSHTLKKPCSLHTMPTQKKDVGMKQRKMQSSFHTRYVEVRVAVRVLVDTVMLHIRRAAV